MSCLALSKSAGAGGGISKSEEHARAASALSLLATEPIDLAGPSPTANDQVVPGQPGGIAGWSPLLFFHRNSGTQSGEPFLLLNQVSD
ncbi:hypothetical protein PtA15_9A339 [Puccinia triticina]|uniref:Uncharacterized protein n=1 Tax=Puccinia triticina TaxID=208348 RepID=A0ABY7CZS8_9BASI|nr:uncharacterized protein PtA15_9A339 [Puccinia triticina]WAQ88212.1 hypothetical protein PtA15_9A339 [Puccinia triticina]